MSWLRRGRAAVPPDKPESVVETMLLPNGQFLLVFSRVGQTEDAAAIREQVRDLPQLTGAAAVVVFDGPVMAFGTDPAHAPPARGLTLLESFEETR